MDGDPSDLVAEAPQALPPVENDVVPEHRPEPAQARRVFVGDARADVPCGLMDDHAPVDEIAWELAGDATGELPVIGPHEELSNGKPESLDDACGYEEGDEGRQDDGNAGGLEVGNALRQRRPLDVHRAQRSIAPPNLR